MIECCLKTWHFIIIGVGQMQTMQFFFGVATACDVAFHAYVYAKIPKSHHKKATSYIRAALLMGKLLSNVSAQMIVSITGSNYRQD